LFHRSAAETRRESETPLPDRALDPVGDGWGVRP
jgi:hypothetical protein